MLTIKSNPAYSVTMTVDIDGNEKTATAFDLNEVEMTLVQDMLNKESLTPLLEYRFQRSFCEGLVDIPLRQAQNATLLKEHIAKSFVPADPEIVGFKSDGYFNQVFAEVANNLQKKELIKIHYDFNSENIRMIEPTKIGQFVIDLLFG